MNSSGSTPSAKPKIIKCSSRYEVSKLCCNQECRFNAFSCRQPSCTKCVEAHELCSFRELSQLSKIVQNKSKLEQKFLDQISRLQQSIMDKLRQARRQATQEFKTKLKSHQIQRRISNIYGDHENRQLYGSDINKIFNAVSIKQIEKLLLNCVEAYKKKGQKMLVKFNNWRQYFCEQFLLGEYLNSQQQDGSKTEKLSQINEKPVRQHKKENAISLRQKRETLLSKKSTLHMIPQDIIIDSHILRSDQDEFQKIKYLLNELNHPSKIKLLFRASQHNFSALEFHKACDLKEDTLTIVKTQFKRTIAAFTSVPWNGQRLNYTTDYNNSTFLLQLDLKERMNLKAKTKAIYNHSHFGPSFGKDLIISDNCHKNDESRAQFPFNYNSTKKKYKYNDQQTWRIFCGATQGCNFKVVQYEVFIVIK